MRAQGRKTSCQVTFLKLLLRSEAEEPIGLACLASHEDVTKQGMFEPFAQKMIYISNVSELIGNGMRKKRGAC